MQGSVRTRGNRLSRRSILRSLTAGAGLVATSAILQACAPAAAPSPTSAPAAAPTQAPKAAEPTKPAAAATTAPAGSPTAAAAKPTAAAAGATPTAAAAPAQTGGITLPTGDALDPLGIEKNAQVDGVFFAGGFGDDYIKNAAKIFEAAHPGTKVNVKGIQRVEEQLRPRFIAGNPPDVIDNSGAGNLDTAGLVAEGQLLDLAPLMEAPSFDTPGKKFKDTLFPGSMLEGVYDGKQYVLFIAYTVSGIWHSKTLFEKEGWEYPKTWQGMLDLCEKIKASGKMAPWTYQGRYPSYMRMVRDGLIYKLGGDKPIFAIDNLEPNAWSQKEVKQATELVYELAAKGYIMKGTEALNHTEAQAEWLKGKAAFIPCGTWLENEMKSVTPPDFNMVINPVPVPDGAVKPFEAVGATAGENYFVPAKAKNPKAGMEFLRILLSRQSAQYFAANVKSMMPVLGGTEGVELSSALKSTVAAANAAGQNVFHANYATWYKKLGTEEENLLGALLRMEIKPDEYISKVQKVADDVAKDPTIKKYKRG